ncbi:hypothetical protein QJQ45_004648 [Haematococcus lacustris]|nr:hypothetical protein QJQ45_004648 [Haematococcus lacustris]
MQLRFDYLAESAFGSDVAILTSPEQRRLAVQQCTLNFPNSTGVGIDWQVAAEALAEELKQSGCSDNVLEMAMARLQQTQARVALHVEKWLAVAEVCLTSSNFVAAADPGQHTGPRAPSELPHHVSQCGTAGVFKLLWSDKRSRLLMGRMWAMAYVYFNTRALKRDEQPSHSCRGGAVGGVDG